MLDFDFERMLFKIPPEKHDKDVYKRQYKDSAVSDLALKFHYCNYIYNCYNEIDNRCYKI